MNGSAMPKNAATHNQRRLSSGTEDWRAYLIGPLMDVELQYLFICKTGAL
jgi:hypothetical protein